MADNDTPHGARPKGKSAEGGAPQGKPASPPAPSAKHRNEVSARFVVLISHERSGSHFLANMLTSAANIASVDEVCNFNAVSPLSSKVSFFRFRHEQQIKNPDFALKPDFDTQTKLMDSYLDHLADLVKTDKILIDIKYGHVHNFEIGWWPSERRPFLPAYLQSRNIKIVHLTRKDSLAAAVSAHLGKRTGVWHVKTDDDKHSVSRIKVPQFKIVREAITLEREKDNFFAWLYDNSCFHIEYEQLSGSEQLRHAAMTELCAFLGLKLRADFTSIYRKGTPPLKDIVENYEDLLRVAGLFGDGRLRVGK